MEPDLFRRTVDMLDRGGAEELDALIAESPDLLIFQCRTGEWYESGYFAGATLLHHVAGNPIRCPLPPNILEITDILLRRGADPNAKTDDGWSTIGLILTGKQVADIGVGVNLIDRLKAAGAVDDLDQRDVLSDPIWNGRRATAEELVRRGFPMDIRHASAFGRIDGLQQCLTADPAPGQALIDEALIYACAQGEMESARVLLAAGAKGDTLLPPDSPGASAYAVRATALHTAASRGDVGMIGLLLRSGADASVIEPTYGGTALDWAEHCGHAAAAGVLRETASAID